ncbi:Uncharacterised protein [Candidatus Anstonella stagnisolia]|nr:Uncharacterised protein [Candidatus Anstonella stagnisolia]
MREKQIFIFLALVCAGLTSAAVGDEVRAAVSSLCSGLQGMLPIAAMLMIVLGAVIYAAGQTMGAETRARANVWATAALTGALMSILIVAVSQPLLNALYPGISCSGEAPAQNLVCGGTDCGSPGGACCGNSCPVQGQVCCNNNLCAAGQICDANTCRTPNCYGAYCAYNCCGPDDCRRGQCQAPK